MSNPGRCSKKDAGELRDDGHAWQHEASGSRWSGSIVPVEQSEHPAIADDPDLRFRNATGYWPCDCDGPCVCIGATAAKLTAERVALQAPT